VAEKKYFWLKLKENFFNEDDMKIIHNQDNGAEYIIFWQKLLLKAITQNEVGILRFKENIPYTPDLLATVTNTNIDHVRAALKIFAELNMIEIKENGDIWVDGINELVGSETGSAERVRRLRARNSLLLGKKEIDEKRYGGNGLKVLERDDYKCIKCGSHNNICIHHKNGLSNKLNDLEVLCRSCHSRLENKDNVTCNTMVTGKKQNSNTEIELELEKEIDIDKKEQQTVDICNPDTLKGTQKNWCSKMCNRYCPDKQFKQCMVWYNEYRKWLGLYLIKKKIVVPEKLINFCKSKTYFPIFENQ